MGYYFLIGLIYTLVNIFIRKLEIDGDWTIVLVWFLIWPVCFIALTFNFIYLQIEKERI